MSQLQNAQKAQKEITYRQLTKADGPAYYEVLHEGYASNLDYGVDFSASHMTEADATAWVETILRMVFLWMVNWLVPLPCACLGGQSQDRVNFLILATL